MRKESHAKKDEKQFAEKDALLSSKDAEVARQAMKIKNQANRIAELEALLAKK